MTVEYTAPIDHTTEWLLVRNNGGTIRAGQLNIWLETTINFITSIGINNVYAQADLRLCWSHIPHVAAHSKIKYQIKQ